MAASISKRQIARNERTLQGLIDNIPGNNRCADCSAPSPGWASWNLGIFLCIRCASIHRKLGVHISKVKSLSMDTWTNEQVESMQSKGNFIANDTYNPRKVKLQSPNDMNDFDRVLEKYIRQKYESMVLSTGESHQPSLRARRSLSPSGSVEDVPKLVVPKAGGRRFGLGLRSTSSLLPKRLRGNKTNPPTFPAFQDPNNDDYYSGSPSRANKPSRVLGSRIGNNTDDTFDAKLAQLRDMGFKDSRQNSLVLRDAGGNLSKAIEELVKLTINNKSSRGSTPTSTVDTSNDATITVEKQSSARSPSNNPFDMPQRSATAPLPQMYAANFTSTSQNPFLQQAPQPTGYAGMIEQSFQQLSMAQTPQASQAYAQSSFVPRQQSPAAYFLTQPQPQPQQNGHVAPHPETAQFQPANPWATGQTSQPIQMAMYQTPDAVPYQVSQPPIAQPQPSAPAPMQAQPTGQMPRQTSNPFFAQAQTSATPQPNPYVQQSANQQQQPQQYGSQNAPYLGASQQQQLLQPQRLDKSSILALYGQPQVATPQFQTAFEQQAQPQQQFPQQQMQPQQQPQQQQYPQQYQQQQPQVQQQSQQQQYQQQYQQQQQQLPQQQYYLPTGQAQQSHTMPAANRAPSGSNNPFQV